MPFVVQDTCVVLLADPGMGKSTLTQWLISSLALQLTEPQRGTLVPGLGQAVPLPFILRDLIPLLPDNYLCWDWPALLDAFTRYRHGRTAQPPLAKPLLEAADGTAWPALLQSPNAFFLIDGLDEIGDPARRCAMRDVIQSGFQRHPQARFLITSRIVGYDEAVVHLERETLNTEDLGAQCMDGEGLGTPSRDIQVATLLYLAPFDDTQQDQFAQHWYVPRMSIVRGRERAAAFLEAVRRHTSTQIISRVPNLLYLLALLYRHKAHLPDGRAQVYAAISEAYLDGIEVDRQLREIGIPMTLEEKERCLATVGMWMQLRRAQLAKEAEVKGQTHSGEVLARRADLEGWLVPHFTSVDGLVDMEGRAKFIDYVGARAGLLLPRREGVYAFAHLSFLEYYAARHLEAEFSRLMVRDEENLPPEGIRANTEMLIEWSRQPAWREVFIFLVETFRGNASFTWAVIRDIFLSDQAQAEANWPARDGQPHRSLPLYAARLLASLSVNRDVAISEAQRQRLWTLLWQTFLRWKLDVDDTHPWLIAPWLLEASAWQSQVLECLVGLAQEVTDLCLYDCSQVTDWSFLQDLQHLTTLSLWGCYSPTSLEPLRGMLLCQLSLTLCKGVTSLEPLSEMPLQRLELAGCEGVTSLEALRGMPLQILDLTFCRGVISLEPLRGMLLQRLDLAACNGVTSLDALRGMPLQILDLTYCRGVTSLEPLRGMPLQRLVMSSCQGVTSLEPLRGMPLQSLDMSSCQGVTSLEPLHGMPLQRLYLRVTFFPASAVETLWATLPSGCKISFD